MISFGILVRDLVAEHFPIYQVGQEYQLVGVFLPTGVGYKGARWIVTFRLEGMKVHAWGGKYKSDDTDTLDISGFTTWNLDDPELLDKLKTFIAVAQPARANLWSWPEIND